MQGSQDFQPDPRNEAVKIYVNGQLYARMEAKVSVFDAGFVLGDGVWEGIRLHRGKLVFLDAHLDRLFAGASAIGLDIGRSRAELIAAIEQTLAANAMTDGVHIRLMVTRGLKKTPNQDPRQTVGPATLVIVAEHKLPSARLAREGLRLKTVGIRCSPAEIFDMRLNSHSRLNLILALQQAIAAGGDEALMLDPQGFISSCNATNFFFVVDGVLHSSKGDYCFNGITRAKVIELCQRHKIVCQLGDFPPQALERASEAFVTGTFGGLTPVASIDDRNLPQPLPGPLTARLIGHYRDLMDGEAL